MNAAIVAIDLAKNIFELAVADADWHIVQRQRLTRTKFFGFFVQLAPGQVVMEACAIGKSDGGFVVSALTLAIECPSTQAR